MNCLSIAFVGLGVMGYPMAGYLKRAGYKTTVFNRTTEKAMKWVNDYQGEQATSPKEPAENADVVFI